VCQFGRIPKIIKIDILCSIGNELVNIFRNKILIFFSNYCLIWDIFLSMYFLFLCYFGLCFSYTECLWKLYVLYLYALVVEVLKKMINSLFICHINFLHWLKFVWTDGCNLFSTLNILSFYLIYTLWLICLVYKILFNFVNWKLKWD